MRRGLVCRGLRLRQGEWQLESGGAPDWKVVDFEGVCGTSDFL